tara:strand:+ start:1847 stop:2152 length:306 start_codon:yes stop_codon:yes gene_type:complete
MLKGKILTHCGNEFTVFFLKDDSSGRDDPDHPLNKHDAHAKYSVSYSLDDLNWMDVNENSAGGGHGFLNYYSDPSIAATTNSLLKPRGHSPASDNSETQNN